MDESAENKPAPPDQLIRRAVAKRRTSSLCCFDFKTWDADSDRLLFLFIYFYFINSRNDSGSGSDRIFFIPEPGPISKWIFFLWGPDPPCRAPLGHGTSGPIMWPKIFFCLILIFSATKQVGEKEYKKIQIWTNRKPTKIIIFSATNRPEQEL